jgi:hypothetical protein
MLRGSPSAVTRPRSPVRGPPSAVPRPRFPVRGPPSAVPRPRSPVRGPPSAFYLHPCENQGIYFMLGLGICAWEWLSLNIYLINDIYK